MRGGKRKGAGAPAGPRLQPGKMAKRINTTMAPDLIAWLDDLASKGFKKAKVIDAALRKYKENFDG